MSAPWKLFVADYEEHNDNKNKKQKCTPFLLYFQWLELNWDKKTCRKFQFYCFSNENCACFHLNFRALCSSSQVFFLIRSNKITAFSSLSLQMTLCLEAKTKKNSSSLSIPLGVTKVSHNKTKLQFFVLSVLFFCCFLHTKFSVEMTLKNLTMPC